MTAMDRASSCVRVAVTAWAVMAAASSASAQFIAPGAPPQYGAVQLRSGFMPDPHVLEGMGGGPVSLSSVDGSCRGYAQQAPSHVLVAQTGFRYLAVLVNAGFDTTLMVQTPDGRVYCNDDGDGLQARVELSTGPGAIRIWVGAYSSSGGGPYRIGFTELQHVRRDAIGLPGGGVVGMPPPPASVLRPGAPPLYGGIAARAGLRPDPMLLTGSAGGPIRASDVSSGCRGYVTPEPSHVITAQSGFRNLRFVVSATHDTTLLIQYPDGRVACDDDGGGSLNPLVEGPTGPGQIFVWVGSYSSGRAGPYTLGLSELPTTSHQTLGGGGGGGPVVVAPPPPVVTAPPPDAAMVNLQPRIPVTIFGPGMTTTTFAVWSPRGGPRVEIGIQPSGSSIAITARMGAAPLTLLTVPADVARESVVTVTQRPDQRVLVRAERPPGGPDPGAQLLLLVQWPRAGSAPEISEQWAGTFRDRAPRWAR